MDYDYQKIENKIMEHYQDEFAFKPYNDCINKQVYLGYSPSVSNLAYLDIYARFLRMRGNNVLFPKLNSQTGFSTYIGNVLPDTKENVFKMLVEENLVKHNQTEWFIDISSYFDDIKNLDLADDEGFKKYMMEETGAIVKFFVPNHNEPLMIFMGSPDLIFGVTFLILDKNMENVRSFVAPDELSDLDDFMNDQHDNLFYTGCVAINPVTNKQIPILLGNQYNNAVAAVPAHDEEMYVYAKRYDLEIIPVIDSDVSNNPYLDDGLRINSEFLDGLSKEDAVEKIMEYFEEEEIGINESFFGRNFIKIGVDNSASTEFTINHVIYHIKLDDSLNALSYIYYLALNEGAISFDEFFKKDCERYLPADVFFYSSYNDFLIAFIGVNILHKRDILSQNLLAMRYIMEKTNITKTDSYDLRQLFGLDIIESRAKLFLNDIYKIYRFTLLDDVYELDEKITNLLHNVTYALEGLRLNEAFSLLEEFINMVLDIHLISHHQAEILLKLLSPFIPFLAEEINESVFNSDEELWNTLWPEESR